MIHDDLPKDLPFFLASQLRERSRRVVVESQLAPELSYGRHYGPAAHDARAAAVIILFYKHEDRWHIPLIVRPLDTGAHSGQVAFPGGVVEPGETNQQAAIRELEEELGIPSESVQLLESISPTYVFVTNYWVTPHLAVTDSRPTFRPNAEEVAEVLEVPLRDLLEPSALGHRTLQRQGLAFTAPHYTWQDYHIWGATSVMIEEMLALLA